MILAAVLVMVFVPTMPARALETVYANTAEELQAAIASNTKIILTAGTYTFEVRLKIEDVENISIIGTEGTKIVTTSGLEVVVDINLCKNVTISNIYWGHDLPAGQSCNTAVLNAVGTENLIIENCDVFGCGVTGFHFVNSKAIFRDSTIRDCSSAIGRAFLSDISFYNCTFRNNGYQNNSSGLDISGDSVTSAFDIYPGLLRFTDCTFIDNNCAYFKYDTHAGMTYKEAYDSGLTRASGCTFTNNTWQPEGMVASGTRFIDVRNTDWFYDTVEYVAETDLMTGTSTAEFSPKDNMTRAMLVTVLYRLEGGPDVTGSIPFPDVKSGQWYSNAILWANQNDIVNGYGNGTFGWNDNITREQAVAILYRYAQSENENVSASADLSGFTDLSSISDWALGAMKWAVAEGLVQGRTATTVEPKGTSTRAEIATIFKRYIEDFQ